jgi:hypothetical protein
MCTRVYLLAPDTVMLQYSHASPDSSGVCSTRMCLDKMVSHVLGANLVNSFKLSGPLGGPTLDSTDSFPTFRFP